MSDVKWWDHELFLWSLSASSALSPAVWKYCLEFRSHIFPCLRSKNHNIGMLFCPVGHKPSSPKVLFLLLMVAYSGFLGSGLHEWYHKHSSLEQYKALFRATFPQPLVMSQRPLIPGLKADPGKWQQPWPGVGFTFCLWSHPKMLKLCLSRRV